MPLAQRVVTKDVLSKVDCHRQVESRTAGACDVVDAAMAYDPRRRPSSGCPPQYGRCWLGRCQCLWPSEEKTSNQGLVLGSTQTNGWIPGGVPCH